MTKLELLTIKVMKKEKVDKRTAILIAKDIIQFFR